MDQKTALEDQLAAMVGAGQMSTGQIIGHVGRPLGNAPAERPNDVAAVLDRVTDLLELAKTELDDCRRRLELVLRSIGTSG